VIMAGFDCCVLNADTKFKGRECMPGLVVGGSTQRLRRPSSGLHFDKSSNNRCPFGVNVKPSTSPPCRNASKGMSIWRSS
jgi:hypothetical protein